MSVKPNGYRYVRSYRGGPVGREWMRWALWEVQDRRAKRVGTAHNENEYRAHLRMPPRES